MKVVLTKGLDSINMERTHFWKNDY